MSTRVEICGIVTDKLPKLTHKECMEMLREVRETGLEETREKFILANMRLVLSVIKRFYHKKESIDDIFQVGCIGLIKAMENFDLSLNVQFSTYAVPMIIGEIRRFLRDCSAVKVSRSIRDTAYKALQAREKIEKIKNSQAEIEDIAKEINLSEREVAFALDAISDPVSLFDPVYNDDSDTIMLLDQIRDSRNTDEHWLENIAILDAMAELTDRERQILNLRFFEGKTQIEVSNEVGISQAQVSRLEKNALKQIRTRMDMKAV